MSGDANKPSNPWTRVDWRGAAAVAARALTPVWRILDSMSRWVQTAWRNHKATLFWVVAVPYCIVAALIVFAAAWILLPEIWTALFYGAADGRSDAEQLADALFRKYRYLGWTLAGFVAALSIPLILYRAHIQARTVAQAEKDGREAERRRQGERDEAVRRSQTERRLRAIEMLGATLPEQEIVEHVGRAPAGESGKTRRIVKPMVVTKQVPNPEVRLGALAVLEELAKEPVPGPDEKSKPTLANHWPVMETVLDYLRERRGDPDTLWDAFHAEHPMPEGYNGWDDQTPEDERVEAPVADRIAYAKAKAAYAQDLKPSADCAAAIAILRRRSPMQHAHELGLATPHPALDWAAFDAAHPAPGDGLPPDERGALWKARVAAIRAFLKAWQDATPIAPQRRYDQLELETCSLAGGDLSTAILTRLSLPKARMEGADFSRAQLEGAKLTELRAEAADFFSTSISLADFSFARLDCADFSRACFRRGNLTGASLRGVNFDQADLEGTTFLEARMEGASIIGTNLDWANLCDARLQNADILSASFRHADLRGAKLTAVRLSPASLEGASVMGADLSTLSESDSWLLQQAFGDPATRLPPQFKRPTHWTQENLSWGSERDRAWAEWRKSAGYPTLQQHKEYGL